MQLERIERFAHEGSLGDFSWPTSLSDFQDRNLIFGWNGTGKSSLARALQHIERSEVPSDCEVVLRLDGSRVDGRSFAGQTAQVRVFNREYVDRAVIDAGEGRGGRIVVVGEKSVDTMAKVTALEAQLGAYERANRTFARISSAASTAVASFEEQSAKRLKDQLRATGETGALANYDRRGFARDVKVPGPALRAPEALRELDIESLESRARGDSRARTAGKPVGLPASLVCEWRAVRALVVASANFRDEPTLDRDRDVHDWVRVGVPLHVAHGGGDCLFCTSRMPEDRWTALQAHFNPDHERLRRAVEEELERLRTLVVSSIVEAPLTSNIAFPDEDAKIAELESRRSLLQVLWVRHLQILIGGLELKLDALDRPLDIVQMAARIPRPNWTVESAPDSLWRRAVRDAADVDRAVAALAREAEAAAVAHDDRCDRLEVEVRDAREALRWRFIANSQERWLGLREAQANASATFDESQRAAESMRLELEALRATISDHLGPAQELNASLAAYLGHDGVKFADSDDGYVLTNRGANARSLSEGEKTAVALLYFLKALSDDAVTLSDTIVVIDDPVSSLDENATFAAMAAIKVATAHAGQLFILTHNFRFFRLARAWFTSRSQSRTHAMYMLRPDPGRGGDRTTLTELDPLLANYDSDYHYLFATLAREANDTAQMPLEHFYAVPNSLRRLLESFLDFRFPTTAEFSSKLLNVRYDKAQAERVLRFAHAFSHAQGRLDVEVDQSMLAETRQVLRTAFDMMAVEDPEHFKRMRKATGVGKILAPVASQSRA